MGTDAVTGVDESKVAADAALCACGHARIVHESFGMARDQHRTDGQCWECDREGHGVECLRFVARRDSDRVTVGEVAEVRKRYAPPALTPIAPTDARARELAADVANDALHAATSMAVCICGHAHPVNLRGARVPGCSACGCKAFELSPTRTLARVREEVGGKVVSITTGRHGDVQGAELHDVDTIRRVVLEELGKLAQLEAMACATHVRANQLAVVLGAYRALERAERLVGS